MEDIYGNLENYEEEKIVQELKNENKELKNKLEEYASTLSNLQKEFDKLSAEYKKLEFNYSSLLKTAKAEIERKTSIITNLNLEKDKLVLNALQKRGRIPPLHHNKNHEKENTPETEIHLIKQDSEKQKGIANLQTPTEKCESTKKNNEWEKEHDSKILQSVSVGSIQKENESIPKAIEDIRGRDREKNKTENKESKEAQEKPSSTNEKQCQYTENTKDKVSRIRQRRKSMPLLKHGDFRFSSDEEEENTDNPISNEYRYRRKSPSRLFTINDRRYDRDRNAGRHDSKDSCHRLNELSRNDERYSTNRDSLRDNYFRNNRQNDSDKYRSRDTRDRYETRYSKRLSPNRSRYNSREYSNDQHRSDWGRQRVTVSSPPEKNRRRSREVDRHRLQNQETHSYKHKMRDQFEGPALKRLKTESPQRRTEEHVHLQNTLGFEEPLNPQVLRYSSLQSPDYCSFSAYPTPIIKEIRETAVTKLDDPRLKSNKYVVNKDKTLASTVVGRNVNIKCVDHTAWKMDEKMQMPSPLKKIPPVNKDFVKEIYSEIHDPKSNLSLESGEVRCSEDDMPIPLGLADISPHCSTDVFIPNTAIKYNEKDITTIPNPDQSKVNKIQATESNSNFIRKWRVPKIDKSSTNGTATEEKREVENVKQCSDSKNKKYEIDNIDIQCQNQHTQGQKNNFETTTDWSLKDETVKNTHREHKRDNLQKHCEAVKTQGANKEIKKYKDNHIEPIKDGSSKLCRNKSSKEEKNSQWSLVDESLTSTGHEDDTCNLSVQCQKNSTKENKGAVKKDSLEISLENIVTNQTHKEDKKDDFLDKEKDKGSQGKNFKEKKRYTEKVIHKSLGGDINTDNTTKDEKNVHLKKQNQERKHKDKEKRDSVKNTHLASEIQYPTKETPTNQRLSKNKNKNKVIEAENLSGKVLMTARDTVEGDLELSDETSDCAESVDPTRYVSEKYVQSAESIKEPLVVKISTEKLRKVQNSDGEGQNPGEVEFKGESEIICENKNLYAEFPPKEPLIKLHQEQTATKDDKNVKNEIKAKFCYLFGDSSSLITPDDLGIVDPPLADNIENKYSPMFDNTQDALDLNVADMEKVQSRSSKTNSDEAVSNINQELRAEKKHKLKSHKSSNERKRKAKKNSESSSGTEHNIENLKEVSKKDTEIIKTVIISSGVQNQVDPVPDGGQEVLPFIKSNTNLPTIQSLPNLKALATSTPHKISESFASASEASCSKSNIVQANEPSNVNSSLDSRSCQNNLDVPDVRIVVKRRRKGKAPN